VVMGVVGDLDDKRSTGAPTARWTITTLKHAACGSGLRAGKTAVLEETIQGETMRKLATIAGSRATSDQIAFTANKRRKHETEFAKAQHQSPLPEIALSPN
jgi:hypothetical protein